MKIIFFFYFRQNIAISMSTSTFNEHNPKTSSSLNFEATIFLQSPRAARTAHRARRITDAGRVRARMQVKRVSAVRNREKRKGAGCRLYTYLPAYQPTHQRVVLLVAVVKRARGWSRLVFPLSFPLLAGFCCCTSVAAGAAAAGAASGASSPRWKRSSERTNRGSIAMLAGRSEKKAPRAPRAERVFLRLGASYGEPR